MPIQYKPNSESLLNYAMAAALSIAPRVVQCPRVLQRLLFLRMLVDHYLTAITPCSASDRQSVKSVGLLNNRVYKPNRVDYPSCAGADAST